MNTIGAWSLPAAMIAALYAIVVSVIGVRRRHDGMIRSGENAVLAVFCLVSISVAALVSAILRNDFSVAFVFKHSSLDLPVFYKWTALWGGMEGSLLFWLWILALYSGLVVLQGRRRVEALMPYALATLMAIAVFFIGIIYGLENPFELLPVPAADGRGLNPLLQDPGMSFHPPTLYLGFVGLSVPFAFAMAALFSGRLDTVWIERTRKWALAAWLFLTMGNLLGGWWAYHVLGWGGYWGWDPVENSAFLPWLTVTAYLHSIQIEERRGMLRMWSMMLVIFSWILTINGTFLTRSGVITSVHSFAEGPIGRFFLGFIIVALVVCLGMVAYRAPVLRSRERVQSLLSREATFLLNNLVLVCGAFAVLWGTLFPILSEAVTGEKISVSAPFFIRIMVPVGLVLLVLMGIGPLISWRRATMHNFRRNFVIPIVAGVVAAIWLLVAEKVYRVDALIAWVAGVSVLAGIAMEFYRGVKSRTMMARENVAVAGVRVVSRSRRRYGGYLVHVGVVIAFAGFAGSAYNEKLEADLRLGETINVGDEYRLTYEGLSEGAIDNYTYLKAELLLQKGDRALSRMYPEFRFFSVPNEQRHTRVAIRSTFTEDVYVYLAGMQDDVLSVDIHLNPLVSWVWGGGLITVMGTLIGIWPARRRSRAALGYYGDTAMRDASTAAGDAEKRVVGA